ncbi:MAG: hypothetical protein WKF30_11370 [Pyrinomonadaceae bacterium]
MTPAARAWLAKNGYDKNYGARPMERLIQQKIKEPLAERLLFDEQTVGHRVLVDEKDDELVWHFGADE